MLGKNDKIDFLLYFFNIYLHSVHPQNFYYFMADDMLHQQLGRLQGQMEAVIASQTSLTTQTAHTAQEIRVQIDKLVDHMNTRIINLETDMVNQKEFNNKIKYIIGTVGSVAGVIGMFGGQILLTVFKQFFF